MCSRNVLIEPGSGGADGLTLALGLNDAEGDSDALGLMLADGLYDGDSLALGE